MLRAGSGALVFGSVAMDLHYDYIELQRDLRSSLRTRTKSHSFFFFYPQSPIEFKSHNRQPIEIIWYMAFAFQESSVGEGILCGGRRNKGGRELMTATAIMGVLLFLYLKFCKIMKQLKGNQEIFPYLNEKSLCLLYGSISLSIW